MREPHGEPMRSSWLYRAVARNVPNGAVLVFDRDLRFVLADGTRALEALHPSKDIVGKTLQEVAHPENLARLEAAFRAALRGETRELEAMRSGRSFTVHVVPVLDDEGRVAAGMALAYDITAQRRMEKQLRSAVDRLGHAFESAADAMASIDRLGRFVSYNAAFAALYEWMRGRPPEVGESADLPSSWETLRATAMEGKAGNDLRDETRGDETRVLVASTSPLLKEQHVRGVSLCIKDVTDARRTELAANRDELTGLCNRRGFLASASARLKTARARGQDSLFFFVDLDGMKGINDRLGHAAGDRALREAAELLQAVFRQDDVLARLGGDEFVAHAVCPLQHAGAIQARLADRLATLNAAGDREYVLAFSMGVTRSSPEDSRPIGDVLGEADAAMYAQKRRRQGAPPGVPG